MTVELDPTQRGGEAPRIPLKGLDEYSEGELLKLGRTSEEIEAHRRWLKNHPSTVKFINRLRRNEDINFGDFLKGITQWGLESLKNPKDVLRIIAEWVK